MSDIAERFQTSGLCPSCFSPTGGKEICPVCGFRRSDDSEEEELNRIKPGTILHDRYVVGRPLGHGGFGITYLGLDMLLEIRLAIKEYFPVGLAMRNSVSRTVMTTTTDLREDFQKGMEKFLEEARVLARFSNHPNIVTVSDFFKENGTAFMVMAYLEGRTLQKHIEETGGAISFKETMNILSPVMDSLDQVHASGMIHRDISPDNIFITDSGQVKLLDFGAAKSAMALINQQSHSVVLKRGYSPYEQYQSRGKLGPWTDVYGMAATIYRSITGTPPPDSLDRLEEDNLVLPSRSGVSIPDHAERALIRALSISSKNRPQSMREFKEGLLGEKVSAVGSKDTSSKTSRVVSRKTKPDEVEKKSVGSDQSSQPRSSRPHAPAGQAAKKPFPVLLAVIGLLVLIGVGVFFYQGKGLDKTAEDLVAATPTPTPAVKEPATPPVSATPETIEQKAEKGDPESQYLLGEKYYKGDGVPQDYEEATKWYKKAAEQGNPDAKAGLDQLFETLFQNGKKIEKENIAKAIKFYEEAAGEGHAGALFRLGELYENGKGVNKDLLEAISYYSSASEKGHPGGLERAEYCRVIVDKEKQMVLAKARDEEEKKKDLAKAKKEEEKKRQEELLAHQGEVVPEQGKEKIDIVETKPKEASLEEPAQGILDPTDEESTTSKSIVLHWDLYSIPVEVNKTNTMRDYGKYLPSKTRYLKKFKASATVKSLESGFAGVELVKGGKGTPSGFGFLVSAKSARLIYHTPGCWAVFQENKINGIKFPCNISMIWETDTGVVRGMIEGKIVIESNVKEKPNLPKSFTVDRINVTAASTKSSKSAMATFSSMGFEAE